MKVQDWKLVIGKMWNCEMRKELSGEQTCGYHSRLNLPIELSGQNYINIQFRLVEHEHDDDNSLKIATQMVCDGALRCTVIWAIDYKAVCCSGGDY